MNNWETFFPEAHDDEQPVVAAAAAAAVTNDASRTVFDYSQQEHSTPYKAWRNERNNVLQDYMEARLLGGSDNDTAQDDATVHDEEHGCETQDDADAADKAAGLDSQSTSESQPQSPDKSVMHSPARSHKSETKSDDSIPHVNDTEHSVQYLSDINLYSRLVSLEVCRVHQIQGLRSLKRPSVKRAPASADRTMVIHPHPQLPRLILHADLEDDGPLATCYSHDVVSIEIQQVCSTVASTEGSGHLAELRQRAEALSGVPAIAQYQRVFFYNRYAKAVNNLLKQTKGATSGVLISLQGVPAKCVVPVPSTDWYSQEHANETCLCIGDESGMRTLNDDGGPQQQVRFDDADMKLYVAYSKKDAKVTEYLLEPCAEEGVSVQCLTEDRPGPLTRYFLHEAQQAAALLPSPAMNRVAAAAVSAPTREATADQLPQSDAGANNTAARSRAAPAGAAAATIPPAAAAPAQPTAPQQGRKRGVPTRASPRAKKIRNPLPYLRLGDLRGHFGTNGESEVNVYAVVLGFGSPAKTKRGDWMVGIALIDETLALEEDGALDPVNTININIFAKKLDELPDIRYGGDVLRMHRVKLQHWNGMQLQGLRKSSYVVCRDDPLSDEWTIRPTARLEFTMTAEDKERFAEMWQWGQKRFLSHPTMKMTQSFKLCDMRRQDSQQLETYSDDNTRGDLTVMVTGIIPVPPELKTGVSPRGFLRIWDGTGVPASDALPLETPAANRAVVNGDPPSETIVSIASIITKLQTLRPEPNFEPPKAVTGRVANAAIWEDSHWDLVVKSLRVGSFIRLRNVQDSRLDANGLRCLMVYSKSYLTPLPELNYETVQMLHDHNQRILDNEPLNPQSGFLPLADGETAPAPAPAPTAPPNQQAVTQTATAARDFPPIPGAHHQLADLLGGPVPTVFSGLVRLVGTLPALSAIASSGIQAICSTDGEGNAVYRFALRVKQDSNDSPVVDVLVDSATGESLLGMKPAAAMTDPVAALSTLQQASQGTRVYQVRVSSFAFGGAKYFLLKSLVRAH